MQQAYRALRVVAESQTIRIVLSPDPGGLMLSELRIVCASLSGESSVGIKAVVLDFMPDASSQSTQERTLSPQSVEETSTAIRAIAQPVLAVVRGTLSAAACTLIRSADFILAANDAVLIVPIEEFPTINRGTTEDDTLTGAQAARLGYVTWSAPANDLRKEMERILDMLRGSSAIALRHTKASVRLAGADVNTNAPKTPLEALQEVNRFYLEMVMQTADAHEGLQAFLEKRKPNWKNA
jgi:enoyl-CoA hydratase/carnithine racemase